MESRLDFTQNIGNLRLHEITQQYGLNGLIQRFDYEIQDFEPDHQLVLSDALALALELHKSDDYKGFPYGTHLIRVMLRLKRDYNVTDIDILTAAILHDSIEDHSPELIEIVGNETHGTALSGKTALGLIFNQNVAELVDSVTNKPNPEGSTKRENRMAYASKVRTEISNNFEVFLIKLSDFTDNGVGLHWGENLAKTLKVVLKYEPIYDIFLNQINTYESTGDLTFEQAKLARTQLIKGKNSANIILSSSDEN